MDVSYDKIGGTVASLLILWSSIEKAARTQIAPITKKEAPLRVCGSGLLIQWRDAVIQDSSPGSLRAELASSLQEDLCQKIKVRNGLCHGLNAIYSSCPEESAKLGWQVKGKSYEMTYPALQEYFQSIAKAAQAISILSTQKEGGIESRMDDIAENREWWLNEFGIRLAVSNTVTS